LILLSIVAKFNEWKRWQTTGNIKIEQQYVFFHGGKDKMIGSSGFIKRE